MICPICKGTTRRLFQKNEYWIRECNACQHRFAEIAQIEDHVERVYGDLYFEGGGAGYPDYLSDAEILISHGRRYAHLLKRYMRPGAVLDVGAAAGFILKGYQESGWIGRGIEPNARMAEYARSHLGLNVDTSTLEEFHSNEPYDLISMIQVIAHFVDPRKALQVAAEITRPGGFWLIETWNMGSWTARIFGNSWHEYSPPSVLHWFSLEGVRYLVKDFGFYEVAHGRPRKWIKLLHAQTIARRLIKGSPLERLIHKLLHIFPDQITFPYVADDIFWALYRKPNAESLQ